MNEKCSYDCGRKAFFRLNGKMPICKPCYDTKHRPRYTCTKCADINIAEATIPDYGPVCPDCYRIHFQPKKTCADCGKKRTVHVIVKGIGPICANCYKKHRKKKICADCGRSMLVHRWIGKAKARRPLCEACSAYRRRKGIPDMILHMRKRRIQK